MSKSADLFGNNIPLVEAAHRGGRQRPTAVLLRTSWTTGDSGAAFGIAQAWHNPNNQIDSCHYVVDETRALRCVPDRIEARSLTREYKGSVSINVCHDPPSIPTPSTVFCTARLTAYICKLYSIPVRILSDADEKRWLRHKWKFRGGIILKTVGDFPTEEFFTFVEIEYKTF